MHKNLVHLGVATALTLATINAHAVPFSSIDPKSMAMGGAGVAVANPATAAFFNPAMLAAAREDDDFALELPIVGLRLADPDDFVDGLDEFQDSGTIDNIDASITNLNNTLNAQNPLDPNTWPTGNDYRAIADSLYDTSSSTDLSDQLNNISDRALQGEFGVGALLSIPSKKFGVSVFADSLSTYGGVINYQDETLLQNIANDINLYSDFQDCLVANANILGSCDPSTIDLSGLTYIYYNESNPADPQNGEVLFDPNDDLKSSVNIRGVTLSEVGISIAHEFKIGGYRVAGGITPKFVRADVFDYTASVDTADADNMDADDYLETYTSVNLDLGLARDYANGWRTGIVIKNLISQEYDFKQLNPNTGVKEKTGTVEIKPMARLGVSHQTDFSTVAVDIDLTENDPAGFEDKSQYVAIGAELNAFDWAQLRLGYRADMSNSERDVVTAGIGLSPLGGHLDLAVAGSSNEVGGALQLGLRF